MEKFLYHCRYLGISPDEACTLLSLTSIVNIETTIRSYISALEQLYIEGYIEYSADAATAKGPKEKFQLTKKGQSALISLSECFPQTESIQNAVRDSGNGSQQSTLSEFIGSYRELFPKGHISSKAYRSTPKDIKDRLAWFKKHYPEFYDFELILKATGSYHAYIDRVRSTHVKTAGYFIKKQSPDKIDESILAAWCQMTVDGEIENEEAVQRVISKFNNDGVI
jgi:hypothetical protein